MSGCLVIPHWLTDGLHIPHTLSHHQNIRWPTDGLHIPNTMFPHHNICEIEEIYPHRHMREWLDMLSELVD